MSLISQVVTRIDTAAASFVTVEHALTTTPIADFDAALPAAMPYFDGDSSEPSPFGNETIQSREVVVAVLIVCQVADLEALRTELDGALRGWEPTGDEWDVFEHQGGDTVQILGGICWFLDRYAITRYRGG